MYENDIKFYIICQRDNLGFTKIFILQLKNY